MGSGCRPLPFLTLGLDGTHVNITYLLLPRLHHVCVSLREFTDIQSVTQVINNDNCVLGLLHHVDVGDAADVLEFCVYTAFCLEKQ